MFAAHVTGNLVILAAHLVNGGTAPVAHILSVPVFTAALVLTRLLVGGLEALGFATLRPLLALQALLLVGVFVLAMSACAPLAPTAPRAVTAGMLAVAAMAVQNALVQISLAGAPSTAVMTTNITRFTMDLGAVLLGATPTRWRVRAAAPGAPGRRLPVSSSAAPSARLVKRFTACGPWRCPRASPSPLSSIVVVGNIANSFVTDKQSRD